MGLPVTWGCPEVMRVHVKQMIVPTIICRARSTLRALFRMAVPPVLSSTSAEYSLQEVKGRTNIDASVRCHRVSELEWEGVQGVSAVRVL